MILLSMLSEKLYRLCVRARKIRGEGRRDLPPEDSPQLYKPQTLRSFGDEGDAPHYSPREDKS